MKTKKLILILLILLIFANMVITIDAASTLENDTVIYQDEGTNILTYPVVDTAQTDCFDDENYIDCPVVGDAFYGQDAQYSINKPNYTDNGNGTVTDNVTGLTWTQSPDTDGDGNIETDDKLSYDNAVNYCASLSIDGVENWQVPTIKQLYSLIIFTGMDPSGYDSEDTSGLTPFIDTNYFDFAYGDTDANERIIDSQYVSSNIYVSDEDGTLIFGVNFADGRIKGYGAQLHGQDKTFFVACVQENDTYGVNDFQDNNDGTITDNATGLMWSQEDSGVEFLDGLNLEEAYDYVESLNEANYLGYNDWRLPNVKELQSIADYSGVYPAINHDFFEWTDEDSYFWTSTSAYFNPNDPNYYYAWYVALGYAVDAEGNDSHGAGAVRFDVKEEGGPAGEDDERVYNYVRLVRGGDITETLDGTNTDGIVVRKASESSNQDGNGAPQGQSGQPQQGGNQMPNFATAAATLGITEEALMNALGEGQPNFEEAANILGIDLETLINAIGMPPQQGQGSVGSPQGK